MGFGFGIRARAPNSPIKISPLSSNELARKLTSQIPKAQTNSIELYGVHQNSRSDCLSCRSRVVIVQVVPFLSISIELARRTFSQSWDVDRARSKNYSSRMVQIVSLRSTSFHGKGLQGFRSSSTPSLCLCVLFRVKFERALQDEKRSISDLHFCFNARPLIFFVDRTDILNFVLSEHSNQTPLFCGGLVLSSVPLEATGRNEKIDTSETRMSASPNALSTMSKDKT